MIRADLLTRIAEAIELRTENVIGDIDADTLRTLRQDVAVVFIEAMQTSGCTHPKGDVFNGFCFRCGGSNAQKTP